LREIGGSANGPFLLVRSKMRRAICANADYPVRGRNLPTTRPSPFLRVLVILARGRMAPVSRAQAHFDRSYDVRQRRATHVPYATVPAQRA
jgi:hypothetical protein